MTRSRAHAHPARQAVVPAAVEPPLALVGRNMVRFSIVSCIRRHAADRSSRLATQL